MTAAETIKPPLRAARWCYGCGLRVDRPPMAGGCDCAHPADERSGCTRCGGWLRGDISAGGCVCLPSWLAS